MYFQDESRFGLFTKNGRMLTARGVKPVCSFHQVFKSTYLFGAFSVADGDSFLMEMPNCNAENFQVFLDQMSEVRPDELKVMVLDNGAFHKAKSLRMPENIVLVFQPPYSPEVNPAEKIWAQFKRDFTNKFFSCMEDLKVYVASLSNLLTESQIIDTCSFDYVVADRFWTNF